MEPGHADGGAPRAPRVLSIVASLVALHALTSFRYAWEPYSATAWIRPNPDFFLLLGIGYLTSWRWGSPRFLVHALTLGFMWVPVMRFALTVMQVFHGKELEVYNDVLLLPGLVHLLLHGHPPALQVILSLLAVVGLVAGYLGVLWLVRRALAGARLVRLRSTFLGAGLLLGIAGGWQATTESALNPWAPSMLRTTVSKTIEIRAHWLEARIFADHLLETEREVAGLPQDLGRLADVDVYVFFVESYGRMIFRTPHTASAFESWATPLRDQLEADGLQVYSGSVYSTVIGGASSLAHAEFLSGIPVPNYRTYAKLLASPLVTLPRLFSRAGHRTLNVQPAMYAAWPEGAFYGFEEDVFLDRFPYDGTEYHWGTMPDQFALSTLLDEEVGAGERPLFVQYISVTSHAPYTKVPPYLEDWSEARDSTAFAGEPLRTYPINWTNYVGHPQIEEAYVDVVRYSLETMVGFARRLTRRSLVIILGDHQPPGLVGLQERDTSHDVPVHVISSDPSLLAPFVEGGFVPGLVPAADFEAFSMSRWLSYFLPAFSSAAVDGS